VRRFVVSGYDATNRQGRSNAHQPTLAQSCFRGMPRAPQQVAGAHVLTGVLCGVLAGALWGMVFIVPELLPGFSPVELAVGRYLAYGAISFGLMLPGLRRLLRRLAPPDYLALLRQALSGNLVYYMLLALGVKLAGVAPTSLIIGLIPVAVTLLGRRDQGAVPLRRLAAPLAIVGIAIACINVDAFLHAKAGGAPLSSTVLGLACAVGALACWTWYAVDNARYLKRNPQFSGGQWSSLYGLASGLVALPIGAQACCSPTPASLSRLRPGATGSCSGLITVCWRWAPR
jgi:drug/metabolite transporter (DMT)-like permease